MYYVKDIHKSFDGNHVLKGVSLDIEANRTTVLVGPSGSGKTTLLRCINLLEMPDSGNSSAYRQIGVCLSVEFGVWRVEL